MSRIFKPDKLSFPLVQLGLQGLIVLLLLLQGAVLVVLAFKPAPSLVQTESGQSLRVVPVASHERSSETIRTFVTTVLYQLFTWTGEIPGPNDAVQDDPGIDIETPSGRRRIPTPAFAASFALSDPFRQPFLMRLAEELPPGVLSGQDSVLLIIDQVSEPQELRPGSWSVLVQAHLNVFGPSHTLIKSIPFHREVRVESTNVPLVPQGDRVLDQAVYGIRQAGLQIMSIQDPELEESHD